MSPEFQALNRRMFAIERQNRQLKVLVGVLITVGLAPLVMGAAGQSAAAVPDVVRAQKFEVVQNGKVVAAVSAASTGGRVEVFDTNGARAGYLRSTANGGSLDISKGGNTVGYFDALARGGAWMCANSSSNQCVTGIGSNADNRGEVRVSNGGSTLAVQMYSSDNGGRLELYDGTYSQQTIELVAAAPVISLYNRNHQVVAEFWGASTEEEESRIMLWTGHRAPNNRITFRAP